MIDANRKRQFDDVFDLLSMLVGGNYVTLYDVKARMTRYSSAIVELVDLPGEYVTDGVYDWTDYIHPEDRDKYEATMEDMLALRQMTYDLTYRVRLKDGDYHLFRLVGGVLRDEDGQPTMAGGMMISAGLTEMTDRVTVMPNLRALFEELAQMKTSDRVPMLLLVGFGRLAHINEMYGYGYGSRLLRAVGKLLTDTVGERGKVYRMEGSKFAVLCEEMDYDSMHVLYEELRHELKVGVEVDGVHHNLIGYGGVILLTDDLSVDDRTVYDCLLHAYAESKRRRHGMLVYYNHNLTEDPDVSASLEVLAAIRESMIADNEGFYLVYQPIFDASGKRVIGAEALLRWKHERYGEILPQLFLPAIEQDYAFEQLGYWIVKNAMKDATEFLEEDEDFMLFLNVAASQISDTYFAANVAELAEKANYPLSNLAIELTRECRMQDLETICAFTEALKEEGVSIGIDDFARGNKWLKTYCMVEPDYVRFHQELVEHVSESERDRTILAHLARMIDACGSQVYVKCVEDKGTFAALEGLPIHGIQGAMLSEAVYYDEILDFFGEA